MFYLSEKFNYKTVVILISSHFNQLSKVIIKNYSLKKCISKVVFEKKKIHFKIAPSKNAFQNYYLSSAVIEETMTLLFFSQKQLKRKKHKFNF